MGYSTNKQHWIKLKNPWLVRTPPGYSCLFIQPVYEFNPNLRLLSGIVDTDTFDLPVEFPGWIVNDHIIKAGDPLMQVIPFKRDSWYFKKESVKLNSSKIFSYFSKFQDRYKRHNWIRKIWK